MDSKGENNIMPDRAEQLEQMLRLYMHEVSHIALTLDYSTHRALQELSEPRDAKHGDVENEIDYSLSKNTVERCLIDIRDSVEMLNLLKNNVRISMDMPSIEDEKSDVRIYKDIIFKIRSAFYNELKSKCLTFITPKVTYSDDASASFISSKSILSQIVYNLIDNAVKFSYHGTNIYVECKVLYRDSKLHTISIVNYGTRIDESFRPYELFYRGNESAFSVAGVGLGLYVAKKSTERLGGGIRHKCKLVSEYYIPYIKEYISRQSIEPADKELRYNLQKELDRLQKTDIYKNIVSSQTLENVSDSEIISHIFFPTYETSFEVTI